MWQQKVTEKLISSSWTLICDPVSGKRMMLSTSSASLTLWDLLWKMRHQMQGMVACPQFSVSFDSNHCRIHPKAPYFISIRKYAFAGGKVIFNSNVINMNRRCAGKLSTEGFHSARLHLSGVSCFTVQPSPPKCTSDHQT